MLPCSLSKQQRHAATLLNCDSMSVLLIHVLSRESEIEELAKRTEAARRRGEEERALLSLSQSNSEVREAELIKNVGYLEVGGSGRQSSKPDVVYH